MRAPRSKNAALRYGLPFVLLVAGGSLGLSAFVAGKYEAVDARVQRRSARSAELDSERKNALAALSVVEYVTVPVPRPAEDGDGGGGSLR